MSTNSTIAIKTEEGYKAIYCNFDGYLSGVGKTLKEHYQDPDKVLRLIDLGDLSCLGERVEPLGPHSYSDSEKGTTVAYHRDRGEKLSVATLYATYAEVIEDSYHVYIFENGAWTHNGKAY